MIVESIPSGVYIETVLVEHFLFSEYLMKNLHENVFKTFLLKFTLFSQKFTLRINVNFVMNAHGRISSKLCVDSFPQSSCHSSPSAGEKKHNTRKKRVKNVRKLTKKTLSEKANKKFIYECRFADELRENLINWKIEWHLKKVFYLLKLSSSRHFTDVTEKYFRLQHN